MKLCKQCNNENSDDAFFCVSCGAKLETDPPETTKSVIAVSEPADTPKAAEYSDEKPQKEVPMVETKAKRHFGKNVTKVLDIVQASLMLALTLVMFIMSFMSVTKVSPTRAESSSSFEEIDLGNLDGLEGLTDTIAFKASPIDIIEGAFARIDPEPEAEVIKDFAQYALDHLSERDQKVLDSLTGNNPQIFRAIDIFTEIVEDYNVFKTGATLENVKLTPSDTVELWIGTAFSFAYIGLGFALFVVALVNFINVLRGKSPSYKGFFKVLLATLTVAVAFAFLLNMMYGGIAFGIVTLLTLGIVALVVHVGFSVLFGEIAFEKSLVRRYVSAAIGAVFTLFMLSLAGGSLVKIFCTSGANEYAAGYNASYLGRAWNAVELSIKNKEILGSAKDYIPARFSSTFLFSMKSALSPAMMGILGNLSVEGALAAVGILTELFCIGFIVVLALSLCDRVFGICRNRRAKLIYTILIPIFAFLLLAMTITYVIIVNQTMQSIENIEYTANAAVPIVLICILAVAETVQRIVFAALEKKK